jgi:NAD/NADP transhydrogenase beta subunit
MNPNDAAMVKPIAFVIPIIVVVVVLALMSRRMLRPRRVRIASLWVGPAFTLVGIAAYVTTKPVAPTALHGVALVAALLLGGGIGWVRARLVEITIDPATNSITQRGTPYGLLLIVGLVVLRSGVNFAALTHPEWGIDLKSATDVLLLFAFGIVTGYATEVWLAVGRARRAT